MAFTDVLSSLNYANLNLVKRFLNYSDNMREKLKNFMEGRSGNDVSR
jgi:hypothetical protein